LFEFPLDAADEYFQTYRFHTSPITMPLIILPNRFPVNALDFFEEHSAYPTEHDIFRVSQCALPDLPTESDTRTLNTAVTRRKASRCGPPGYDFLSVSRCLVRYRI
jgi:hypothetical protein